MSGETVQFSQPASESGESKNERSTIGFPYLDLDVAVDVAKSIYARSGLGTCNVDELAAQMKQTISSGAFRLKTITAKTFDLVDRDNKNGILLSELGRAIVQPDTEPAARAEAFLRVPLYSKIFDKYRGHLLPPPKALEREMQALGVSSKQAAKARQAFERSAREAGFFASGEDRLVRPRAELPTKKADVTTEDSAYEPVDNDDLGNRKKVGNGGGGGGYHPFVQGLLDELPASDAFGSWSIEDQAEWLTAAAGIFKLLSKQKGRVEVSVNQSSIKTTATDR